MRGGLIQKAALATLLSLSHLSVSFGPYARAMRKSLLLLPLALASCAPLQQAVQVPTVQVENIYLRSLSLPTGLQPAAANVTLRLKVGNPNPVAMRMANVAANLIIDGSNVGNVNLPNVNLPARGETIQLAEVSIPVTIPTATSFLKVARGQQVSYRLDGSFTADFGPLGQPTFGPFTLSQGVWKQAPILPF